jgi:catechol 2,3-dioxygenase-like lactoylglutathione lyase family enzyme
MHPQISTILIGVKDLTVAKRFYSEGLGCPIDKDFPAFVSFNLGNSSSALGLYGLEALAADAGVAADGSGFRGVTLSYDVDSTERVDEVLAQAQAAGGRIVKPAQNAQWGGYFGYFSDPDGYLWKVASES